MIPTVGLTNLFGHGTADMKKARKYQSGGVTEDKNPNISEDVRKRALMYVALSAPNPPGPVESIPQKQMIENITRRNQAAAEARDAAKRAPRPAAPKPPVRTSPPAPSRPAPSEAARRVMEEGRRLAARDYQGIEAPWGLSGFKAGGKVVSASRRADGIAQRGKTRGRII